MTALNSKYLKKRKKNHDVKFFIRLYAYLQKITYCLISLIGIGNKVTVLEFFIIYKFEKISFQLLITNYST